MIIQILLSVISAFLYVIFGWLPTITELPFGIDAVFVTAFGWLRYLITVAWPIQVILNCVLYYLSFRLLLLIVKVFLGSRTPHHD